MKEKDLSQLWQILAVNVCVFAAVITASFFGVDLIRFLAVTLGSSLPWAPFTYMFTHAGVAHFVLNMAVFVFYGYCLCRAGSGCYLWALYLCSGLLAAMVYAMAFSSNIPLAGSSAAVLGVVGATMVWQPKWRLRKLLGVPLMAVSVVILLFVLLSNLAADAVPVLAAHMAGFGGGVAFALVLSRKVAITTQQRLRRNQIRREAYERARRSGYASLSREERESLR